MNFESPNLIDTNKNDPFWLYKFPVLAVFKLKIIRFVLVLCVIVHTLETCSALYCFTKNYRLFLQYSPVMFMEINMLLSAASTLFFRRTVEASMENSIFWSLDSCSRETQNENAKFIRRQSVTIVSILILAHLMGVVVLLPNESDKDLVHILYCFENTFPKYAIWFGIAYKLSMVPLLWALAVYPFLIMYNAQHAYVQGKMYKELMRNLTSDFEITPELMYDSVFQNTVQKRLRFCIQRHVEILLKRQKINKDLVGPLLPVLALGCYFFSLGALFLYFGIQMDLYAASLRNMVTSASVLTLLVLICCALFFAGQSLEDDSENVLVEIKNSDWYVWNYENRMAMLMMLSTKTIGLEFSDELSVNYAMGMRMCQAVYSAISLFASFRN